ncbi:hypothetical protein, partial [Pseudanabaena sp. lw0831]|uniref:hypothetical protein n=1 Tax=Pseudanabaena sp. lw0831 TaxID=1357935 RepID=UPI001F48A0D9
MADIDDSDNQQPVADQSQRVSESSQFDPSKPNTLRTLISSKFGQSKSASGQSKSEQAKFGLL